MNSILLIAGLSLTLLVSSLSDRAKAESQTIPLDQIWAYKMPGVRDVEELATRDDKALMELIFGVRYERAERLKFKNVATPGFAVSGSGRSLLHAALAIFLDGRMRCEEFSSGDEITLVFFSEFISRYRVQIRQVERKENEIEIQYELQLSLADRLVGQKFVNFALIPLGKLPVGKYEVQMRQLPRELTPIEIKSGFKPLDEKWSREFLCKPFTFTINKKVDSR